MIKSAQAAVLHAIDHPLRIEEVILPPLVSGQVLVQIFFSGVCRSQVMEATGGRGEDRWLPHMLGHEGAGKVVAVGEGVTKVSMGDDVILGWIRGDGLEAPGAVYSANGVKINSGQVTTFSNYSIVSENRVYKKPAGLPFDHAVLFGCALLTGAGMVLNEIRPTRSDTVAVVGLGGIGISALIMLGGLGVKNIVAIDVSEEKLSLAKSLGASHVIRSNVTNVTNVTNVFDAIESIYPGGVDYCIESAGSTATIELGFRIIRAGGGKLLFASHPPEGEVIQLLPHDLISGKQISGSWGGASLPDRDIPRIYESLQQSAAPLELMLRDVYPLVKINQALDDLAKGRTIRPLIQMSHETTEAGQ